MVFSKTITGTRGVGGANKADPKAVRSRQVAGTGALGMRQPVACTTGLLSAEQGASYVSELLLATGLAKNC